MGLLKYVFPVCFMLCLFSCHTKKQTISKVLYELLFFSMDSLANINYFDYYGKPVRELIKNDVIRAGGGGGYAVIMSSRIYNSLIVTKKASMTCILNYPIIRQAVFLSLMSCLFRWNRTPIVRRI